MAGGIPKVGWDYGCCARRLGGMPVEADPTKLGAVPRVAGLRIAWPFVRYSEAAAAVPDAPALTDRIAAATPSCSGGQQSRKPSLRDDIVITRAYNCSGSVAGYKRA
jgi:hypothetical protein